MLNREVTQAVFGITFIVGAISLINYFIPDIHNIIKIIAIILIFFSGLLIVGKLLPVGETDKSIIPGAIIGIISYTIFSTSSEFINQKLGLFDYNVFTDGIVGSKSLLSFIISMLIFAMSYWILSKLFNSFNSKKQTN